MTHPNNTTDQPDPFHQELGLRYECSEVGNMWRFADQHEDKIRYIPQKKGWAMWDGMRWKLSGDAPVFDLALSTARSIYDEARDCTTEEGKRRLTLWVLSSQTHKRLQSMINMAAKSEKLVANINTFDTDLTRINCKNGIVDLRTGELIDRSPSDSVMKLAPVDYSRHAKCPAFDAFLQQVFKGDNELIGWMQRALGYTLTGLTSEQVLFLAHGTGANGKSTLFETVLDIMGDYGRSAEFDTFLASDRGNTRVMEGVAKLQGARFALASETDSTKRFSEAVVKKVTGGDTVTGSFLYGSSFEFRPQFALWLLANHLPSAKDGSHGFWRRMKVIPFDRKFSGDEIDQTTRNKLAAEAEGILAWCVQGAVNWFETLEQSGGSTGLGPCAAVDEAVDNYRDDQDVFRHFMAEALEEAPEAETPAGELFSTYKEWFEHNGHGPVCSQSIFGIRLSERGIEKKRRKTGNVYLGIRLNADTADF